MCNFKYYSNPVSIMKRKRDSASKSEFQYITVKLYVSKADIPTALIMYRTLEKGEYLHDAFFEAALRKALRTAFGLFGEATFFEILKLEVRSGQRACIKAYSE